MDLPILKRRARSSLPESRSGSTNPPVAVVRWLGTAGFSITSTETGHVILFDPYLTRASLARIVLGKLEPDLSLVDRYVPRADAIILGHTHFDHALDAPGIAKKTGAMVFGSRSASNLCRASGVDASRVEVVERDPGSQPVEREVGPFRLRFSPSAHSRFFLGRVPFPGEIADCDDVPMRVEKYRCGAVFAIDVEIGGKRIAHLGSAELVDERARDTDLLLLCAAGWTSSGDLPERAMRAYSPDRILLSHWDDFFSPIDRPARPLPALQLPRLLDRLGRASRDTEIGTLPLLGEVEV